MNIRNALAVITIGLATLSGCASVPMAPKEQDAAAKQFVVPDGEKAGLYIFRNSSFGAALKKLITLDGVALGQTAPMTYFYKDIAPGKHIIKTEAEFGDNQLEFVAEKGKLIFLRNYIKMGTFVGSANIEQVSEADGKSGVLECSRAVPFSQ